MRVRPQNKRPLLFGVALIATLVATWWASTLDDSGTGGGRTRASRAADARSSDRGGAPSSQQGADSSAEGSAVMSASNDTEYGGTDGSLAIHRNPLPDVGATLIRSANREPVVEFHPPSEPPQAPPLPFRYIGTLEQRGKRSVILLEGNDLRIASAGERIDTRYRVETIAPTQIEFTYLPLKQRQSLEVSNHESSR